MVELSYRDVRKEILPESVDVRNTGEMDTLDGIIIGQDRAVSSLRFGLQIDSIGFNIYVSGPPGIGKMTSVRSFLEELAHRRPTPQDWCYIYNFKEPYEPKTLTLPPGNGMKLKTDLEHLVARIREDLPQSFESEEYGTQKEEKLKSLATRRDEISEKIGQNAKEKGFGLQPTPMGLMIVPVRDGKPMDEEAVSALPEEERKELDRRREDIQKEIKEGQKEIRRIEKEVRERTRELDRQVALNTLGGFLEDIRDRYREYPAVGQYLSELQEDMLENLDAFKAREQEQQNPFMAAMNQTAALREQSLHRYQINVVVDNSDKKGAPVIVELNPTYVNLVGRIEKEMRMGAVTTDFSLIRAGALALANGGYLVLPVEDVLRNFGSWEALKRSLRSCELRIEEMAEQFGYMTIKTLRPHPIPLSIKVILVGQPTLYHLLYSYDPEFPELFKVKADYDTRMKQDDENIRRFLLFTSTLCRKENLRHLDRSAIGRLLEHAARAAEHQDRISINFGHISDVIREANHWAGQDEVELITEVHVRKTLEQRVYRSNLIAVRIREMIEEGVLLIETEGTKVGQLNGLSVLDMGDYSFGQPNRITAIVHPGQQGVVDIERETKLGGPIHTKGVLVLSGCLAGKYSQGKPLTLSAQLVFEQSYGGIDGDSASQAELYALVSALSGIPFRQDVAVTGSVDQMGRAQAIGGVNQKIEGFFDVCRMVGLTGNQGVMIPWSNRRNLMLREDVTEAVKTGAFHIWAVKDIDEGIEILSGEQAGERREDGTYALGTVNRRVVEALKAYTAALGELRDMGRRRDD